MRGGLAWLKGEEDRWLEPALYLFALTLPVTISISEALAFALLPIWIARRCVGRVAGARWEMSGFLAALFVCVAALSSLMGVRPAHSLEKLTRFALLAVAFLVPVLDARRPGLLACRLLGLFLAGATLKAGYDVVRIPLAAGLSARAMPTPGAGATNVVHHVDWADLALFSQGNMRDPQFYSAAVLLFVALWPLRRRAPEGRWLWLPLLVNALALVLHFKRGAMAAAAIGVLLIVLCARRPRLLLALAAIGLALCAVPQFRERVAMTRNEFSVSLKGRYPLWTEAAPRLLKEHPFGMGWKALRYEDLRAVTPHVQRGLNHLHNNAIQVAVDTGWLGAAVWMAWMAAILAALVRAWRYRRAQGDAQAALALGLVAGFVALMLNGLVEYNFGDTEIFMLLSLFWGCGLALRPRGATAP